MAGAALNRPRGIGEGPTQHRGSVRRGLGREGKLDVSFVTVGVEEGSGPRADAWAPWLVQHLVTGRCDLGPGSVCWGCRGVTMDGALMAAMCPLPVWRWQVHDPGAQGWSSRGSCLAVYSALCPLMAAPVCVSEPLSPLLIRRAGRWDEDPLPASDPILPSSLL